MHSNGNSMRRQTRSSRYGTDVGDATEAQCIIDGLGEGQLPPDQRHRQPDNETYGESVKSENTFLLHKVLKCPGHCGL